MDFPESNDDLIVEVGLFGMDDLVWMQEQA